MGRGAPLAPLRGWAWEASSSPTQVWSMSGRMHISARLYRHSEPQSTHIVWNVHESTWLICRGSPDSSRQNTRRPASSSVLTRSCIRGHLQGMDLLQRRPLPTTSRLWLQKENRSALHKPNNNHHRQQQQQQQQQQGRLRQLGLDDHRPAAFSR